MAKDYQKHVSTKKTSQREAIPGSTQVENSAGGYAWSVDRWSRLDRFLILGSDGGTYYLSESKLTKENATIVMDLIKEDGVRVVQTVVDVSVNGRAPKNDPALFVLAMCLGLGDYHTKMAAELAIPKVARIGTHIFALAEYVEAFRGWGRSLRRGFQSWYLSKDPDKLAYQLIKYRQRNGWSHKDLLRLCKPTTSEPAMNALFRHTLKVGFGERDVKRDDRTTHYAAIDPENMPELVLAFDDLQKTETVAHCVKLLKLHKGLSWEMIPTELMKSKRVWEQLIENGMPMTALIRNLARLTANGTLKPMGGLLDPVIKAITDPERIRKARVHPIQILAAQRTYDSAGQYSRSKLEYTPIPQLIDALDEAFYMAFENIEPSGKRTLIGLDVSGSMLGRNVGGGMSIPGLTARYAAAAMCMVTVRTEPWYMTMAFCSQFVNLSLSPKMRLDDVLRKTSGLQFGRTDCALPMLYATQADLEIDTFIVYTDNETWAGTIHPSQALAQYRQKSGINAKLIVVAMTSSGFTIADPNDVGMLDVVGFDTSVPQVMANFAR